MGRLRKILLLAFCFGVSAFAETSGDKLTDLAALRIQDRSIQKLKSLVKQYHGTSKEIDLLHRLADLYLQRSGITFRITEGGSEVKKKPQHVTSLKEAIATLSVLIKKYPHHTNAPYSYFKRAKALKELGLIKEAKQDYHYVDGHYPEFEYLDVANMDLAKFAQDENRHGEALTYFAKVEKMPNSAYFGHAKHGAAWSYYNLENFDKAEEKVTEEVDHHKEMIEKSGSKPVADDAFIESAYSDFALFSFEALNRKKSTQTIEMTVKKIQSLDIKNRYFGSTILKFARLLKAYRLLSELETLKKHLVNRYKEIPETLDVVVLIFQYHFDQRNFDQAMAILPDLKLFPSPKVESLLSNSLSELHKLVIRNKASNQVGMLLMPLAKLTESVDDIFGAIHPTTVFAKYSLAETAFELGFYGQSTRYYEELMNPQYEAILIQKKVTSENLALRLLSSRYRELKKNGIVPETLAIRLLNAKPEPLASEQLSQIKVWIDWVDKNYNQITLFKNEEDATSIRAFYLESTKVMYQYLDTLKALDRFKKFAFSHPKTKEGQVAITVVIDTLLKAKDAEQLYQLCQEILAVPKWNEPEFLTKVGEIAATTHYEITLRTENPEIVLARTQECITKFKNSKTYEECLILHAKAELKRENFEVSEKELSDAFTKLSAHKEKNEDKLKSILLLRSDARSRVGRLDASINDLFKYQEMSQFQDETYNQMILQHSWLKHDFNILESLLKHSKVCSGKNQDLCDQYRLARMVETNKEVPRYSVLFQHTSRAPQNQIALWALLALENSRKIAFKDKLTLITRLSKSWDQLNPFFQLHFHALLQERIAQALGNVRASAPAIAPLSAEESSIERRIRLSAEIDRTLVEVMKLNWLQIKINSMTVLQGIYQDLIKDLRAIQTPEASLKPLEEKITITSKAVETFQKMSVTVSESYFTVLYQDLLLSSDVKSVFPKLLWHEWKNAVTTKNTDYLFYLLSVAETTSAEAKSNSPLLKGLVLSQTAPTEGYALIDSAPDSVWKKSLLSYFKNNSSLAQGEP